MRLVVALSVALALVGGAACQDQGATPPSRQACRPIRLTRRCSASASSCPTGVQRSLLQSDTAFTYDDNTRFELRTVRSTFYTETGVKNATLTSRQGHTTYGAGTWKREETSL
jgi:hypothetical protein